jgi:hypothetical protein
VNGTIPADEASRNRLAAIKAFLEGNDAGQLGATVRGIYNATGTTIGQVVAAIDAAIKVRTAANLTIVADWNAIPLPIVGDDLDDIDDFEDANDEFNKMWAAFTNEDKVALAVRLGYPIRRLDAVPPATLGAIDIPNTIAVLETRRAAVNKAISDIVGTLTLAEFLATPNIWRLVGSYEPLPAVPPATNQAARDARIALAKLALDRFALLSALDKENETAANIYANATATLQEANEYGEQFDLIIDTLLGSLSATSSIANIIATLEMIESALGTGMTVPGEKLAKDKLLDGFLALDALTAVTMPNGLLAAIGDAVDEAKADLTLEEVFAELISLLDLASEHLVALRYAS